MGFNHSELSSIFKHDYLGIFQPVMGKMIDRFGPKAVIASSAALMGAHLFFQLQ